MNEGISSETAATQRAKILNLFKRRGIVIKGVTALAIVGIAVDLYHVYENGRVELLSSYMPGGVSARVGSGI